MWAGPASGGAAHRRAARVEALELAVLLGAPAELEPEDLYDWEPPSWPGDLEARTPWWAVNELGAVLHFAGSTPPATGSTGAGGWRYGPVEVDASQAAQPGNVLMRYALALWKNSTRVGIRCSPISSTSVGFATS